MATDSDFFREVTLRICGSLEIDEALAATFDYLAEAIPLQAMVLLYYDPSRSAAYVVGSYSRDTGRVPGDDEEPLFRMEESTLDRLRVEGASVNPEHPVRIHNRPRTDPINSAYAGFLARHGLGAHSNLVLRLDVQRDYQGVLLLSAAGHDAYTSEHARLIGLVEEPFAIAMSNARRHAEVVELKERLAEDNRAMHREMERLSGDQVIGADYGLRSVMEMVRQVAPTNTPVLLMGETGTGKEVIANAIHATSPRRDGPMVRVQCGAIPETLFDSELFGHEKGAFTGAVQRRRGRFERADGGTIFLDEIGELTLEAQVKLLRVLQDRTFERLGGAETLSVDVRVIAATNRELQQMVNEGGFRQDLWFRLSVFPLQLPPLRQRREDIAPLTHWLIDRKCRELGISEPPALASGAMDQLGAYDWPGNVRELQNVIERELILCGSGHLEFAYLGRGRAEDASTPVEEGTSEAGHTKAFASLAQVEADHIRTALAASKGRVEGHGGAAEMVGLNPSTLRARMAKLGITIERRPGGAA